MKKLLTLTLIIAAISCRSQTEICGITQESYDSVVNLLTESRNEVVYLNDTLEGLQDVYNFLLLSYEDLSNTLDSINIRLDTSYYTNSMPERTVKMSVEGMRSIMEVWYEDYYIKLIWLEGHTSYFVFRESILIGDSRIYYNFIE